MEIAAENGAAIEYARISQSPWFTYRKNGMEHVVWFEDVRSITAKWDLIREFGLSGARYWNLMRPVPGQLAAGEVKFQKSFRGLFLPYMQKAGQGTSFLCFTM